MGALGTSVLLVTPNDRERFTCRGWLREEGIDVIEASTAAEALECHRRASIPLTISDVRLPEYDGIELLKRIHELNADAEVALLADGLPVEYTVSELREIPELSAHAQDVFQASLRVAEEDKSNDIKPAHSTWAFDGTGL